MSLDAHKKHKRGQMLRLSRSSNRASVAERFQRASQAWERGEMRRAFRLFLFGAKSGDTSSRLNLGFFYDEGIGVRPNRDKAIYWYRLAYQAGDASAAKNIGLILRAQGADARAVRWFDRAMRLGDIDSALNLGEIHDRRGQHRKARALFARACRSSKVTEQTRKRACTLLRQMLKSRHSNLEVG